MTARFVFLDIETTGLDPDRHELLEIGAVMTDENFQPVPTDALMNCFVLPKTSLSQWDPWALEQHAKSGLLLSCIKAGTSGRDAVQKLVDFLSLRASKDMYLAGSSLHFDIDFLNRYPQFGVILSQISHRRLDLSSFRLMDKLSGLNRIPKPPKGVAHRTLEDCWFDIDQARTILAGAALSG